MKIKLKPLAEQVVVITGATSGIGLVTARSAAVRGARVFLIARGEQALRDIVEGITAAGGTADFAVADVGDAVELEVAAAKAVSRFGRIDTWISDAGAAIYAKLLETPLSEHQQLFQTNYFGAVNCATYAVPRLRVQGGALITVGSIAGDIPSPLMGAYSASKHAIKAYVQSLRIELEADQVPVSVTLIKPSGTDTPIGQHAANHEGGEAQIPPPVYDPQLVANAILAAAERPTREITVGGIGRAQVLFGVHFPILFDKLAPTISKLFIDKARAQSGPNALFTSRGNGRARSGETHGLPFSLYNLVQRRPALFSLAAIASVLVVAVIARQRRNPVDLDKSLSADLLHPRIYHERI
jgi:short-subunit dehydrogenase